jgi:uncharacterized protein YacL
MTRKVLQFVGVGVAAAAGVTTFLLASNKAVTFLDFPYLNSNTWPWAIIIGVSTLIIPYIILALIRWSAKQIREANIADVISAVMGLIVGLIPALLLSYPLSQVPLHGLNLWLPLLAAIIFGYLGAAIFVLKREEIQRLGTIVSRRRDQQHHDHDEDSTEERSPSNRRQRGKTQVIVEKESAKVLLDTSSIIDGRIADISQTGFIMGSLVVPRFVLEELQRIADSADTLRRNRGRRGLDILNRLQKESNIPVDIVDIDFDSIHEVDAKLVKLAKQYDSPIITNDFNLNKVAELQGVKVLNINELANAVKPALLPGEDMDVKIIQEGKEFGQGVGYLDDGTMIVVEGGKPYLNNEVEVTVTRVLQTAAGRMIFAHPKVANGTGAMRRTS